MASTPALLVLRAQLEPTARDALVSFLFDGAADDPLLEHAADWCAWDGGPPAPAEDAGAGGSGGAARIPHPEPCILHPEPQALSPKTQPLNPEP